MDETSQPSASPISPNTESAWSDEELAATVQAYLQLLNGSRQNKASTYRELSERFQRTPGAYERRMQNISAVLEEQGKTWLRGLSPLRHIGVNVRSRLEHWVNAAISDAQHSEPYEPEVIALLKKANVPMPRGQAKPAPISKQVVDFVRDQAVKAWVLEQASGMCECCEQAAPFRTRGGLPFLEVHHVHTLADGGADTIENTVALCPNCHRHLHHGDDADALRARLYAKVARLKIV